MTTWVLVASAARARIFEGADAHAALREVSDLVNPEDRLLAQELKSDKPGRAFDIHGGHRHAMETPVDPKEQAAIRFAKQVVEDLEAGLREGRFDSLYLIAAPRFLGLLRGHIGGALAATIKGEAAKDLTREDPDSIQAHIADLPGR